MDTASQGPNCFAERRERILNVIEYYGQSLSVLADELALVDSINRGKNGNSQCILDLPRRGEAGIEHFHCDRAADSQPEPDKQRSQQDFSCVGKALPSCLSRH